MLALKRKHHNTYICYSESKRNSHLFVSEIGYSTPPAGYRTSYFPTTNCYTLHYLVRGEVNYHGRILAAPCVFLLTPESHAYSIDARSEFANIEQYWILVNGDGAKEIFEGTGLINDTLSAPCPYIDQAVAIFRELQKPSNYVGRDDGYYMLSGLFSLLSLHDAQTNPTRNREVSALVDTMRKYIDKNYTSITHERDIASALNVSVSNMNKRFKAEMGSTPMKYLTARRLKQAKNLLRSTDLSVAEIAESVGFSNPNYFCLVFKKHCDNLSPSAYRKRLTASSEKEAPPR